MVCRHGGFGCIVLLLDEEEGFGGVEPEKDLGAEQEGDKDRMRKEFR